MVVRELHQAPKNCRRTCESATTYFIVNTWLDLLIAPSWN